MVSPILEVEGALVQGEQASERGEGEGVKYATERPGQRLEVQEACSLGDAKTAVKHK